MLQHPTSIASATVAVLAATVAVQAAPISIDGFDFNYTENFDSLASTAAAPDTTVAWADDSTINGWSLRRNFNDVVTAYTPDDGASVPTGVTDSFLSYGADGATDRALGLFASGGDGTSFAAGVIVLQNNTGQTLTGDQIQVSYDLELWNKGVGLDDELFVYVAYDQPSNSPDFLVRGNFGAAGGSVVTQAPELTGSVADPGVTGQVDGNTTKATISGSLPSNITLEDGEFFALRFISQNTSGADSGFGVDNVSIAIPEPTSLSAVAIGSLLLLRRAH
ncbi:MAG: hypothetical protein AAF561_02220 [Planctomycetota bacterium]